MTLLTIGGARRRQGWPLPESGTLTNQPTYDGSGKTIHPSVVDMVYETGSNLGGYRWWMADTPYPDRNELLENPSIWASNDRINWTVPEGVTNPVVPPPPTSFHADTDLVWNPDLGELFFTWRDGGTGGLGLARSDTGSDWDIVGLVHTFSGSDNAKSPTLVRVNAGLWRMYGMGTRETGVHMWTATSPYGPWTKYGNLEMPPVPYHGQVISYQGVYIALCSAVYNNTYNLVPYASADGITWQAGSAIPVISRPYRATITPSTVPGQIDAWISEEPNQRVRYYRYPESTFLDLLL